MKEYFNPKDDFKSLTNEVFIDDECQIEDIPIGWTNVVQRIYSKGSYYIGRFPRDDFWAEVLIHECQISNYLQDKVSTQVPKLNLYKDIKGRVFSIHEEIPGVSFASIQDEMSSSELKFVAEDIASFLSQIHSQEVGNLKLGSIEDFINRLAKYHGINLEIPMDDQNSTILVHGDFNSKNIILNSAKRLEGVIDFGFASVGNVEWDLSRICHEEPKKFEEDLLHFYEQISHRRVNMDRFTFLKKLWSEICEKYVEYMIKK